MDAIVPWAQWVEIIRSYYYNNTCGRKPKDIEVMLRMYLMQNWFRARAGRTEDLCRGYTPFFRKIRETRQKEGGNDGHNGLIFHNFIKNCIETI